MAIASPYPSKMLEMRPGPVFSAGPRVVISVLKNSEAAK
jgi:hypothetical protein